MDLESWKVFYLPSPGWPHTVKNSHALPLLGSVVGVLGQVAEPHLFGLWGAETNNELVTTNRTMQLQHTPNRGNHNTWLVELGGHTLLFLHERRNWGPRESKGGSTPSTT